MKMPDPLYAQLRDDIHTVCEARGIALTSKTTESLLWNLFHVVMKNRLFDDSHPGFAGGLWERYMPKIEVHWLDQFYKDADLNDSHILTALRKIARDHPVPFPPSPG
jgi:hypothetical protein